MKRSAHSPFGLTLCIAAGISVVSLLQLQPSWAQTATDANNPLQDFDSQQNGNPFSSRGDDGQAFSGIMQLMHRAQQGSIRSINDYSTEQNQNLDAAAAKFRQRQLQMMQNQTPVQPANNINTPPAN